MRVGETERNEGITDVNVYGWLIEDAGGLDKIENLQIQENRFVYLKSAELLDNYFEEEDADMLTMSDTWPLAVFFFFGQVVLVSCVFIEGSVSMCGFPNLLFDGLFGET